MTEFDGQKYDLLVWEHLKSIGILIRPEPIKGSGWCRVSGYWFRWFWVEVPGGKRVRRCYRVNNDQSVERMV